MNDTINTISSLRSIHGNFSDKDITESDLKIILNSAISAANASARQSYSLIVIDDKKVMKDLMGYVGSKAVVFCVDFNRLIKSAQYLNHEHNDIDIINFITGTVDTILALQTSVIAAKSLGIDSLITNGVHRNNLDLTYITLGLPEKYCFPLMSVVFGYCTEQVHRKKGRLNNESIIHYGKYNAMEENLLKETIAAYNDSKLNLGLIDDWEKQGFKNYLDWFFTKWSVGRPVEKTNEFYSVLKRAGFLN